MERDDPGSGVAAVAVPSLPMPLRWLMPPVTWHVVGDSGLSIEAGPRTDLFISPGDDAPTLLAPRLVGAVQGDFQLSARVSAGHGSGFDAAVLLLWVDGEGWAKLCFECSPELRPMVVSVVTRGRSDDANAFEVDGPEVHLRVARLGDAFAFHASLDGAHWQLIRHFGLDLRAPGAAVSVGFLAQSPLGSGCRAEFRDIRFTPTRLAAIRDGG